MATGLPEGSGVWDQRARKRAWGWAAPGGNAQLIRCGRNRNTGGMGLQIVLGTVVIPGYVGLGSKE